MKTQPGKRIAGSRGFTLTELMIVASMVSLLAAIALPKFGEMIVKSREAAIKGHLGSLRSALSIYYSDNEGFFPSHPYEGLAGKYFGRFPTIAMPAVRRFGNKGHVPHDYVITMFNLESEGYTSLDQATSDKFHWFYDDVEPFRGFLCVQCQHRTTEGRPWSTY